MGPVPGPGKRLTIISPYSLTLQRGRPALGTPPATLPLGLEAPPLTLVDFLLVAELGRVLLFSWEELELFSSSSSSSSKLMLLETPGPGREAGRHEWLYIHTQIDTVHRH